MPFIIRITVPRGEETSASPENHSLKIQETTPEDAVKKVLKDAGIQEQTWRLTENNMFYVVEFQVFESSVSDQIVDQLAYYNIGKKKDTSIMILEPTVTISYKGDDGNSENAKPMSSERFKKFVQSLKSRITIAQVYESIRQRSVFDLNYLAFLLCAAIVADIALVTNSVASVFASMLLSPLMDPIMCVVYGLVLEERTLLRRGLRNGVISLIICVLTGFIFGIPAHYCAQFEQTTPYPTSEMRSRVRAQSLISSVIVATFSGLSVAFANLQNSVAALIGNAISLSLLPPAVNCGTYFFLSLLTYLERSTSCGDANTNSSSGIPSGVITCRYSGVRDYELIYVDSYYDMPTEFAISATISFFLTGINIILIIITGYFVNKLKDLAPKSFTNNITRTFYKEDLKAVAENYKCLHDKSANELAQKMAQQALKTYLALSDDSSPEDIKRKTAEFNAVVDSVATDRSLQRLASASGVNWVKEFIDASKDVSDQRKQIASGQSKYLNPNSHHTFNTFNDPTLKEASGGNFFDQSYNHFSVGPTMLKNYTIHDVELSSAGQMFRYNQMRDLTQNEIRRINSIDLEAGIGNESLVRRLSLRNSNQRVEGATNPQSKSFDGDFAGLRKNRKILTLFNSQKETKKKPSRFKLVPVKEAEENLASSATNIANEKGKVKFSNPDELSYPGSRKSSTTTTAVIDDNSSSQSAGSMTGRFSVVKTEYVNTPN